MAVHDTEEGHAWDANGGAAWLGPDVRRGWADEEILAALGVGEEDRGQECVRWLGGTLMNVLASHSEHGGGGSWRRGRQGGASDVAPSCAEARDLAGRVG